MQKLNIQKNVSLARHTTLGAGGNAPYYVEVTSTEELRKAVRWAKKHRVSIDVLGGGSNVLIPDEGVDSLVLHMKLPGCVYEEQNNDVYVTVGAGVLFDTFVKELVEKELWGLENLSAIPGTVGATPIQNVGAYGVEVSDHITTVVVYDTDKDEFVILNNTECCFGYRDSLFKQNKHSYIVVWVVFKVSKNSYPNLSYNDLERYFKEKKPPTINAIRKAIIAIRGKKFPDWHEVGTAGSFFKNPIVTPEAYKKLRGSYPNLPGFSMHDSNIKIPLGYVLDKLLNLKGYREGNVGLYKTQALVLVAYADATTEEILSFARMIQKKVHDATGLEIDFEVTCIKKNKN